MTLRPRGSLVDRLKSRDDTAFVELVHLYEKRIKAYVRPMVGAEADDVCQEIFLRIVRSISTFSPERGSLTAWIYTISRNTTREWVRRRTRDPLPREEVEQGDPEAEPCYKVVQNERVRAVRAALLSLPEHERTVLILREYEELSYQEIARIMGRTCGAIRQLLFRARRKLAQLMSDRGDMGDG